MNHENKKIESAEELTLQSLGMILYHMGIAYAQGRMTGEKDYKKAIDCYRQAAKLSNANAMYAIAISYANGLGVALDHTAACNWYTKAAELGHDQAMYNLGLCFEHGWGVEIDIDTSFVYFRRAAALGNQDALKRISGEL